MGVEFSSSGKLGDILKLFKSEYLKSLTPEDLEKQVKFSIQERVETTVDEMKWLREKLVEVISND